MSLDIGLHHVATHRAGSAAYYNGRPRGTVAVYHDNKLYLYGGLRYWTHRAVRNAIAVAFAARVRGTYPNYSID